MDFNRNVVTQTFLGLSALDLKSNTQDASLIHERISMEMFTRMGVPAPREVSTRVFINGAYLGLFNLVETPDGETAFGNKNQARAVGRDRRLRDAIGSDFDIEL